MINRIFFLLLFLNIHSVLATEIFNPTDLTMSLSEKKSFELFDNNNKLLYKKNLKEASILFYGVDRESKFLFIQTNDYNYLYNIEKKTSHQYKNNFKAVITSFAVKSDMEMVIGTDRGLLFETERNQRIFKASKALDYGENLAIRDIRFSKNKDWFYALAQRGNYNKIGYKFSNELISDLQTETSRIGYKPIEGTPSAVHKTAAAYTKSYEVVNLDLLQRQQSNALKLKTSHTQNLTFFKQAKDKFKKLVQFSEISSFDFNENMSFLYASSKLEKSTFKIDMVKFFEEPSKSFQTIKDQHSNFIKAYKDHVFIANADDAELTVLNSKKMTSTKIKTDSAIRGFYESGDSLFIIEENGSIHLSSVENGETSIQKYFNVERDLARDVKLTSYKNTIQLTTATGEKVELFFPRNCSSVFAK